LRIDTRKILKKSVHDIVVDLPEGEYITIEKICELLQEKYNIQIKPEYLLHILKLWLDKKITKVFGPSDTSWLYYKKGVIYNGIYKRDKKLGKSRQKLIEDEKNKIKVVKKDIKQDTFKIKDRVIVNCVDKKNSLSFNNEIGTVIDISKEYYLIRFDRTLHEINNKMYNINITNNTLRNIHVNKNCDIKLYNPQQDSDSSKEFKNLEKVDGKLNVASTFALTSKVLYSMFKNITEENMEYIRDEILTDDSIKKNYYSYWNNVLIIGRDDLKLELNDDYDKYNPIRMEDELN
jgi:hypothetical protein